MKKLLTSVALAASLLMGTAAIASAAVWTDGCKVVLTTDNPDVLYVNIYLVVDPEENPGAGRADSWETLEVIDGVADTMGTWVPGTYEADWGDGTSDTFTITCPPEPINDEPPTAVVAAATTSSLGWLPETSTEPAEPQRVSPVILVIVAVLILSLLRAARPRYR